MSEDEGGILQHVAQRIRDLRTAAGGGMSQKALAKALGKTANTISRLETGTYKPALEDLDGLSRFFGVSILEFFPREDASKDEKLSALLRAAKELNDNDVEELRRYAEFMKARSLYGGGSKPRPGRKRKNA